MDLERGLLLAALNDRELLDRIPSLGIVLTDFQTVEVRRGFEFVRSHVADHGALPSVELVCEVCRIELVEESGSPKFLVDEFLKRKLFFRLRGLDDALQKKLTSNDPIGGYEALVDFVARQDIPLKNKHPHRVTDLGDAVMEIYDKVAAGFTGVQFPWESMTETTLGMWPGTATYFIARPGVGKTWVAWIIGRVAWLRQYRVLIISPEMSKEEGAERFFVLEAGVSGKDFLRGQLSSYQLANLKQKIANIKGKDGLWIVDYDDGLTVADLESYIRAVKPHLVAIDAAYMLPFGGRDRTENMTRAVDWIRIASKKFGKEFGTAFVAFHQLSRAAVKSKSAGGVGYNDAAIALSDQVLWDAYSVWIMEQDADMKADKRIKFHCSKIRRGIFRVDPIETMWDFDRMNFKELKSGGSDFTDSEFSEKKGVPF